MIKLNLIMKIKKFFQANLFYIFISLFLFLLFGFKDLFILFSDNAWPHLYSVINSPFSSWEETYLYLSPILNPFSKLPIFFPVITFLVHKILFSILCLSNIDFYLFVQHTILPICSFWVLYLIFKTYIKKSWAVLLAFFGITFYNNFSSIKYFANLLLNPGNFINSASLTPLEITRTPIPSVTFLLFITVFYLSIKSYRIALINTLLLSIAWALQIYIYPFNFIAGISFWILYLFFITYLQYKRSDNKWKAITFRITINFAVILIVTIPAVAKLFTQINSIDNLMISANAGIILSSWGAFTAYILPLILLLFVIIINCSDYYELFYRFLPVFIMIIIEIIILNSHLFLGKAVQPYLFSLRIGNFFTRFLYFLPIIYFLCNPHKKIYHNPISNNFVAIFNKVSSFIFIKKRFWITSISIALLSLVVVFSNIKYIKNHLENAAPQMKKTAIYGHQFSKDYFTSSILLSENMATNLFISLKNENNSFIQNSFTSPGSQKEILNRLILFGHIFNWDEEKFLSFMLPNEDSNNIFNDNNFIASEKFLNRGFGYWLMFQNKNIDKEKLVAYKKTLINKYLDFDLLKEFSKYPISQIQAFTAINKKLSFKSKQKFKNNTIYNF